MYFTSCLLCGFVTFCVIFAAPTTLLTSLQTFTHEKCPSYEILATKSLFLDQCTYSHQLQLDQNYLDNGKNMLCSLYDSVFQHFCASTNSSFYNITKLTKEFDQIREEFSSKPTEICNSLKLINSTILKPDLVKVLNKQLSCVHVCTDYEAKVIDVCSLTSFIWNLTVDYRAKESSVDPKPEIVTITSGKQDAVLPKVGNEMVKSKTNTPNENVNNDANQLENTAGVQQSTSDDSLAFQGSPDLTGQVSIPKDTIKVITTQDNKQVPKLKTGKSTAEQNGQVQVGEANVAHEKQSNSKPKTVGDNKPEATNAVIADSNAKKIKTNEINVKPVEIKSNDTDLVDKPSIDTQIKENSEKESIKNKPIVLQSEKEAKKQDDNLGDKPDDTDVYVDKDDDDDENDFLPPKKVTKGNEEKAEDNVDELPLPKSSEVKTKPEVAKPKEIDEDTAANYKNQNIDDSDSYFFSYFMMVCVVFICGYVAYHNKQKILALVLEGRKGRRPSRTRRPNSSNYRKLDSTLEEAVTSSCNKNSAQVIY